MSGAFTFDSAEIEDSEPFEAYRALYSSGSDASCAGPNFRARVEAQPLGRLVLFERWLNDVAHERTAQRARGDGFEHFTLQLNLAGCLKFTVPDGAHEVLPGEIAVFDMTRPQRTEARDAHILTFSVAREMIEAISHNATGLHGRVLSSQDGGLLSDLMQALVRRSASLVLQRQDRLMLAFGEVMAMAFTGSAPPRDLPLEALERARVLVDANLGSKQLSPDWLAERAGLSRTRLYDLFRPLGGVSRYIQERRAVRLRALLIRSDTVHQGIAELAFEAGFANESHAARVFRDLFGTPPGRFRREFADAGPALQAPEGGGFDRWIRSLN